MSGTAQPSSRKLEGFLHRRGVAIAIAVGIAVGGLLGIAAGGEDDEGYLVRAIFDNGSFVIPGEDVKIAGVKVGAIHDVELTRQNKAAVVLKIDDPAFAPFREGAQCQIRLQSLIGEQFIECRPSRPVKEGEDLPLALARIDEGPGEGQHLLPVDNNVTPVPVDLIRDISRLPQQEGLRLIINELGAGLAGNGERLRAAVRRANPALKETGELIEILASQDRVLGRLIDESDEVLAAWVQRREETAGFIDHAGATAVAAAERGDDIERNFERLPAFLRELKPTTEAFSGLADQMTPALNSLAAQAPAINASIERLGPFAAAGSPALVSLGDFADRARELFPEIRPLVGQLDRFGRPARPATDDLAKLFGSFRSTGGIEELMKLIYFYTGTVNGVDEQGHYVRSLLAPTNCIGRTPEPSDSCGALFKNYGSLTAAAAATAAPQMTLEDEPLLDYLLSSQEGEQ